MSIVADLVDYFERMDALQRGEGDALAREELGRREYVIRRALERCWVVDGVAWDTGGGWKFREPKGLLERDRTATLLVWDTE